MTKTSLHKLPLISLLALLPLASASATTYKCVEDGRVSYQGTPCKKGTGSAVNVVPADDASAVAASKGTETDPNAITARFEAEAKAMAAERRLREINYESQGLEKEISQNKAAMKSELDTLQEKRDYWKRQPGGANWAQGTELEMQLVAEKYKTKIKAAQDKLDDLNKEKNELRAQIPRSETKESSPKD